MRLDDLFLWHLGNPAQPRYVGRLQLASAGKGVSLHYGVDWLASGFALSEDLPLIDAEFLTRGIYLAIRRNALRLLRPTLALVFEPAASGRVYSAVSIYPFLP